MKHPIVTRPCYIQRHGTHTNEQKIKRSNEQSDKRNKFIEEKMEQLTCQDSLIGHCRGRKKTGKTDEILVGQHQRLDWAEHKHTLLEGGR